MSDAVVVDTNVLVIANDPFHETGPDCVEACVRELKRTQAGRRLLLDWSWKILSEYRDGVTLGGQGGVGTEFFKSAAAQTGVQVRHVHITPHPERGFSEFPDDPALETFDKSDRKFVAVALASGEDPPILHATDRGWKRHRGPLVRHGVLARPLCRER